MRFRSIRFLLGLVLVAVASAPGGDAAWAQASASNVKALIIGIGHYPNLHESQQLKRTVEDARAFADYLVRQLRIPDRNVKTVENADLAGMNDAWKAHVKRLQPGDVSIVYFSGHGMEEDEKPYILGNTYRKGSSPSSHGLKIASMVSGLDPLRKKGVLGIFVIDACRSDPSKPRGKDADDGAVIFAPVRAAPGTFVFYSAGPGQIALEDIGPDDISTLSLYTRVLLPLLGDTDRGLHEIAKIVRWEVAEMALQRKVKDNAGVRELPHIQVPSYYDEVLTNVNILGASVRHPDFKRKPLPKLQIAGVSPGTRGRGTGRTKSVGDETWECLDCPEMMVIAANKEGRPKLAIGRFEVTRGDWFRFESASKRQPRLLADTVSPDDSRPMTGVSHADATAYTRWLSEWASKELGQPAAFRLPTEEEWEIAARAGSDAPWPSGYEQANLCLYANGADASLKSLLWTNLKCDDGKARGASSVGSYRPNAFGIYDTAGNVWEWVTGCTERAAGASAAAASATACTQAVAKGGSWRSNPQSLTYKSRLVLPSDHRRRTIGFRIVQVLDN